MLHSPYTNQKKETERKFEQESRLKQSRMPADRKMKFSSGAENLE
jgi:hypothetical protein